MRAGISLRSGHSWAAGPHPGGIQKGSGSQGLAPVRSREAKGSPSPIHQVCLQGQDRTGCWSMGGPSLVAHCWCIQELRLRAGPGFGPGHGCPTAFESLSPWPVQERGHPQICWLWAGPKPHQPNLWEQGCSQVLYTYYWVKFPDFSKAKNTSYE